MATVTKARPKQQETVEEKPRPIKKLRLGAQQMSIWANEHVDENGEVRVYHTANLEHSYRDKNGDWKKTEIKLNRRDFGDAIALIQGAQQFLTRVE